jgi:hypothetical protein
MEITIIGRLGESAIVSPDPAIVCVGEPVIWNVHFDTTNLRSGPFRFRMRFRWRIYFRDGIHPFEVDPGRSEHVTDTDQSMLIASGNAQKPGDYKYGVLIGNADTGDVLSDDDPRLIVRRHLF